MADIVTSRVFTDGERGITAAKLNDIVGSSVIQPAFYSAKPVSSTLVAGDKLLALKSTGSYAQADFQNVIDSVSAAISSDAEIWSVRLRSFNAIGNPNFEVDQRSAMTTLANPASGTSVIDRWSRNKVGTMADSVGAVVSAGNGVLLPGTNFSISRNLFRVTLTTQQTTLGSGDYLFLGHAVEGPGFRPLKADVHSLSLLVQSSVAGLKFSATIRDPGSVTKSLTKLCTITSANTWQLIQLPNLPIFPSGNFTSAPGSQGYGLVIALACGSTFTAPAADTWQNGSFLGAPGMSNFAASPVNSTFDIAFVQHEPGAVCSTLMDKPFTQNYDECLRFFCKSYDLGTIAGSTSVPGSRQFVATGALANAFGSVFYPKPMAKNPTVVLYNTITGVANSVQDGGGVNHAGAAPSSSGTVGFSGIGFTTATASAMQVSFHCTADTGW
jgi:hypothetical protein